MYNYEKDGIDAEIILKLLKFDGVLVIVWLNLVVALI